MSLGHFLGYIGYFNAKNPGMDIFLLILLVAIWVFVFYFKKKSVLYAGMIAFAIITVLFAVRQFGVCCTVTSINKTSISVDGYNTLEDSDEAGEYEAEIPYNQIASLSYDKEKKMLLINTYSGDTHQWTLSGNGTLMPWVANMLADLKYEAVRDSVGMK